MHASPSDSPCPPPPVPPRTLSRDTLNTPFFGQEGNFVNFKANGALPADFPYAPIPRHYDDTGSEGTTYRWPFPESDSYYSLMYSGMYHIVHTSKYTFCAKNIRFMNQGKIDPRGAVLTCFSAGMAHAERSVQLVLGLDACPLYVEPSERYHT